VKVQDLPSQIVLVGESGLGKTAALLYLMYLTSRRSPDLNGASYIPWYVPMRNWVSDANGLDSAYETLAAGSPTGMAFTGAEMRESFKDSHYHPS